MLLLYFHPHACAMRQLRKHADFSGILSANPWVNPRFHNWNAVYVVYCDGGSFTGWARAPVRVNRTLSLHFHGAKIFDAVIRSTCDAL